MKYKVIIAKVYEEVFEVEASNRDESAYLALQKFEHGEGPANRVQVLGDRLEVVRILTVWGTDDHKG